MSVFRIIFHASALAACNLAAILVGFAFYKVSGIPHQLAAQVPAAIILSAVGFSLYYAAAARAGAGRLGLRGRAAYAGAYVATFAWLPVLFVPLHYVTQGYLTSFANVYYTWLFQAQTNALALAAAYVAARGVRPRLMRTRTSVTPQA